MRGRGRGGRGRGTRGSARGRGGRGRGGISQTGRGAPETDTEPPIQRVAVQPVSLSDIAFERVTPNQLRSSKLALLNTVASSLLKEPRFSDASSVSNTIKTLVARIAFYDPEFVLKLALYSRDDLNIRSTSNYLVSIASNVKACQPFLKKYVKNIVRLPSDWLDIAATYQALPDRYLKDNLPTALRKALVEKFSDFDGYQLGKYNKERSIKRKARKAKKAAAKAGLPPPEQSGKRQVTLKQMIRQLHVSAPTFHVMCLLGKKYPMTLDEFRRHKLPGTFDPKLSGKRMKLPLPETWETLLSAQGNRAGTWEELLDHNKLPFMAMLRNLRNLIFTGVHPRCHRRVIGKLTNEQTIANSRQFPTRFFAAYEAIPKDLADMKAKVEAMNKEKEVKGKDGETIKKKRKRPIQPAIWPTDTLFAQYREALDTAVKLATVHNVKPIRGSTVVLCEAAPAMLGACKTAGSLGGGIERLDQVGALLGLMCQYACEDCDFRLFNSAAPEAGHLSAPLVAGSILENVGSVLALAEQLRASASEEAGTYFPYDHFEEMIRQRKRVDTVLVLSHRLVAPGHEEMDSSNGYTISSLLHKYRQEVNADLLFVSVDLSGRIPGLLGEESDRRHPNDVLISGFSDSILRFIAERGDSEQLAYVERIDTTKKLTGGGRPRVLAHFEQLSKLGPQPEVAASVKKAVLEQNHVALVQPWRTARLFISSTFRDMHAERDLLIRYVLPELRERCKQHRIHLFEVDLRWGVTEEEALNNKSVQICLDEVDNCTPFFIGLIGNRYGWAPSEYVVPEQPKYDWVRAYPPGRSITELEIQQGCLRDTAADPHAARRGRSRALFYVRDGKFLPKVPAEYRADFVDDDRDTIEKLDRLRAAVESSGYPVCHYKPSWGGVRDGKPMVKGLDTLRQRMLDDIWREIIGHFPADEVPVTDEVALERGHHMAVPEARARLVPGRDAAPARLPSHPAAAAVAVVSVSGKAGVGKSSLVAAFALHYSRRHPDAFVVPHFVGASRGSDDVRRIIRRVCLELVAKFGLETSVPEEYEALRQAWPSIVEQAAFNGRILLLLDGLDQLLPKHRAAALEWLPARLPIKVVLSCRDGPLLDSLRRRRPAPPEVALIGLAAKDRKEVVRTILAAYNKRLDERPMNDQMRVLVAYPDADLPLYLTLACQELRVFGVYEELSTRIAALGGTIGRLMDDCLERLESDHGRPQVRLLLSLLLLARGGLLESELRQLLRRPEDDDEMPLAVWTRLLVAASYLLSVPPAEQPGPIVLGHAEVAAAVRKRYLDTEFAAQCHRQLARFFLDRADPTGNGQWTGTEGRAFSELPHHLWHGGELATLGAVLTSLIYVEAACRHGLGFELLADYVEVSDDGKRRDAADAEPSISASTALNSRAPSWKGQEALRGKVDEFRQFLRSNVHILNRQPDLTYQQAANQPDSTYPAQRAREPGSAPVGTWWVQWALGKPQQRDPCTLTLQFGQPVTAACFSPDGSLLACAATDCAVRIVRSGSGQEVAALPGHSSRIAALAFSPDQLLLASASWDESTRVWDVSTGGLQVTLTSHKRLVNGCVWSPDGKGLLTASWDGALLLSSPVTGTIIKSYKGHMKPVNCACFSPDGKLVVSGSWDSTIKLFNSETAEVLQELSGHTKSIRGVAFAPNGRQLVSCGMDNTIRLWDAVAGKEITALAGHSKSVNSCAFSPDGMRLLSASDDATVKVWTAVLGTETNVARLVAGFANAIAYSPDGKWLATAGSECQLVLYDALNLSELGACVGHSRSIGACVFTVDSRRVVSGSDDSTMIVWDRATRRALQTLSGHRGPVTGCVLSADGAVLVSTSDDFTARVWAPERHGSEERYREVHTLSGHTAPVRSGALSPNGKLLVTASRDTRLLLWNTSTGKLITTLGGHLDWINHVAFSPNGKRAVSCSWDYNLKVWDVAKAEVKFTLTGHTSAVSCCAYSPDGKKIISSSYDGTLKVWDASAGTEITSLIGHAERINGLAVSPTGEVASVSDDATIRVWDALAGSELATLVGHAGVIDSCSFCPVAAAHGRPVLSDRDKHSEASFSVLSCSADGTVKVWDAQAEPHALGHAKAVNACAFSADGLTMASGSDDHSLKVWNLQTQQLQRALRGHSGAVRACVFVNDSTLASGGDEGLVYIWDIARGSLAATLEGHTNSVRGLAASLDGQLLASCAWDGFVRLWDLNSHTQLHHWHEHTDWVLCVAFASGRRLVLSGSADGTAVLYDTVRMAVHHVLKGHRGWVLSCASSGAGLVATADVTGLVIGWDVDSGRALWRLECQARVNCLRFSANSKALLAAAQDGTMRIYSAATQKLISQFVSTAPCTALAVSRSIVLGDDLGRLYLLQLSRVS
eukprot:TRINITY_DN1478_c0_g2_i3.p1 TRINITY_DN1478_c0_g2~~TRINITY_DN1478_c0_g2_i3.p1  ORF type:complete len:2362 (+),score=859.43 TRINITY_DN1478_c0_g2_i3:58-7143(+)